MKREQLLQQLQVMDEALDQLFQKISGISQDALNHHPGPGKWSAQQIMNHLILSEKYSLGYCKKKLSFDPDLKKAGLGASFKEALVKSYFVLPLKLNAPKGIDTPALPPEDTFESVETKWQKVRNDMRSFLENVDDKYLNKEVYKHPFAGRLTLKGMMSFFMAHFRHHRKQIDRAVKNATI